MRSTVTNMTIGRCADRVETESETRTPVTETAVCESCGVPDSQSRRTAQSGARDDQIHAAMNICLAHAAAAAGTQWVPAGF